MDKKEVKYEAIERESDTVVSCSWRLDNLSVSIRCFIDDDNTHVALRCFGFIHIQQDQFAKALMTCNQLNIEYRWVKFVIDDDLDLNAYDDAVISADTAGEELFELLIRMTGIVDDCYPKFMKTIWS